MLTEMMADEFNSLRPETENYKAEADADLIPIPGQLELHGRCGYGVLLSPCFGALFVAFKPERVSFCTPNKKVFTPIICLR